MILIQPHQLRWMEHNLTDNDVPFVVIGGVAVKFHFPARETEDVDLFVGADPVVIERLVAGIPDLAQDPKAKAQLLDQKVGHFKVAGEHKIDVLSFAPGLDFGEAHRTAETCEFDGISIRILSRPLLIAHKRAVGEPKDLEDVKHLEQMGAS
ncbi:MAG: hypothetical protein EOR04_11445 [Mesorhizobium sp.]|uniref:nucleotidyl transferase AbiEii/AbiGii toxin family protein n=1 Tax=Mesorhizobium sp. TaxID=1871066 RepID=UPI000FE62C2C|nr:nucleotidyl transferase AbiEii/AbiGii toxin family protein [Mesorhizobium sp.]RWP42424.1 MAG: hypothetical protein EOR04_11445 [Mesorhizobium sp.]